MSPDFITQLPTLFRYYAQMALSVVFVVDSTDRSQFELCKEALRYVRETLGLPLLVLANKQDCPKAVRG
jgi:signal recognition particle receptor subunit beta